MPWKDHVPSETLNTPGESTGLEKHGGTHTTVAHFM